MLILDDNREHKLVREWVTDRQTCTNVVVNIDGNVQYQHYTVYPRSNVQLYIANCFIKKPRYLWYIECSKRNENVALTKRIPP